MRLLFLTNFYPPAGFGGYEQWCQEVACGLQQRGHEVEVLTSQYGLDRIHEEEPAWIRRDLFLEMKFESFRNSLEFFTFRKKHENENLSILNRAVKRFNPDCIFIWGMWNLTRSLPAFAENLMPDRVIYYIADYWPTLPSQHEQYWRTPARNWTTAIFKPLIRSLALGMLGREKRPILKFNHVIFPSVFIQKELFSKGVVPMDSKIIIGAIHTEFYSQTDKIPEKTDNCGLSLIYVGRLTKEKGVHTALQALGILVNQYGIKSLTLSIVGSGDTTYEIYLYHLVKQEEIEPYIKFHGSKTKEAMPEIYKQHDILLFTSIWPEPFGRVIIEAMVSGLVVVGTATGGASEIQSDHINSLVFRADDPDHLAAQIMSLIKSPELRKELSDTGRKNVQENYDIHKMVSDIELYIERIIGSGGKND